MAGEEQGPGLEDEANYFILNFRKKCYKLALMIFLGPRANRCRDQGSL
jgi:hypothetical protein